MTHESITRPEFQYLDACDDEIWDQLGAGEILETAVSVEIPDIVKSLGMVGSVGALLPVFEAMSKLPGEDGRPLINPREVGTFKGQLPVMEEAASVAEDSPVPVVGSLVGDPRYKVFMRLKRNCIQTEQLQDIEGDARLIAAIQTKVLRNKPLQVESLLRGMPSQNRRQRRSGGASSNHLSLRYPAAVVTPIAIFR